MLNYLLKPATSTLLSSLRFRFGILKFNLPDLGEKIKEGTIKKLYVKEGDKVQEFQKLADVASDKQFTQITASDAGIIRKIHYKEEDICQVGQLLLQIQVKDSKGDAHQEIQYKTPAGVAEDAKNSQQHPASTSKSETKQQNSNKTQDVLASPYIRGLIKQKKLDINKIKGTGPDGRILQADVLKFISETGKKSEKKQQKPSKIEKPSSQRISRQYGQKTIKMNNFEKGMQKSMTQSNKIPHLYLHQEFDITETEKMRKTIKSNDKKVTLMGILIKTFSLALKKYPIINSTYEPQKSQFQYTMQGSHNISIAIDSPNGLVVPNIKNVQDCSLLKIQQQLERLRSLASEARLTSKELNEGTVCLSNIGTIGGVNACPLILPPQVCIVAIGKMQTLPKYIKDQLQPRTVITVSYGCDHRVIDGATVARFSNEWKRVLENPYLALAEMN